LGAVLNFYEDFLVPIKINKFQMVPVPISVLEEI